MSLLRCSGQAGSKSILWQAGADYMNEGSRSLSDGDQVREDSNRVWQVRSKREAREGFDGHETLPGRPAYSRSVPIRSFHSRSIVRREIESANPRR